MRALVVGLGSIGRRHLANLRWLVPDADITVWRQRTAPGHEALPAGADQVVYSLDDAMARRPEIAIIANPAPFHIDAALPLARCGASLLVEKPISCDLDGVEELIGICRERPQTLMVGYNLRFDPALRAAKQAVDSGKLGNVLSVLAEVGQYLPDWRPGTDYSHGVSAQTRLGGGAVMELSHELDYTRWLLGEVDSVLAQTDRLGDLEMDAENIADIQLRFANGSVGNVHLDMLQRAPARFCKLIGTEGTLLWDGISHSARIYLATHGRWEDLGTPVPTDRNDAYIEELRHFLDCVQNRKMPLVSGEDGLYVLKIALAVHESARQHREVHL